MAISKVIYGNDTLIDLTEDSVTPETLAEGATAHDASGNVIHGVGKTTSVLFTEQTLTDTQKEQARENIGALAESELQGGIDTALAQAKASGEFKGEKGYTPVKGIDYFTEADKQEIAEQAAQLVDIPEGGATSWNDLTDKPFGVEGRESIVWDGNTEGLESIQMMNGTLYKVSDEPIPLNEFIDSVLTVNNPFNGETTSAQLTEEIVEQLIVDMSMYGVDVPENTLYQEGLCGSMYIVYNDVDCTLEIDPISLKRGVYILDTYFISLTFPQTIKTLDEKYIPDTIARNSEVPTKLSELENDAGFITKDDIPESSGSGATPDWSVNDPNAAGYIKNRTHYSEMVEGSASFDGDLTGKEYYGMGDNVLLVKMSNTPLSVEELLGSTVTVKHNISDFGADGDTVIEFVSSEDNTEMQQLDSSNYMIGVVTEFDALAVIAVVGDCSSVGFPPEGTYFTYMTMGEEYFYAQSLSCLNGMQEVVHKIDEKYLPTSVVLEGELEKKGYQTEEQVTELVNNKLEDEGYQTKEQVTKLIDNALEVDVKVSYEDLTDVPVGKYRKYVIPKLQAYFLGSRSFYISNQDTMSLHGNKVYFDGEVYDAQNIYVPSSDTIRYIVGNPSIVSNEYENNGSPIAFVLTRTRVNSNKWNSVLRVHTTDDNLGTTRTVALFNEIDKQLDEKYIPSSVVLESELESKGYQTEAQVTELINNALGVIENAKY